MGTTETPGAKISTPKTLEWLLSLGLASQDKPIQLNNVLHSCRQN